MIEEYARLAGFGRPQDLQGGYQSFLRSLGEHDAYILSPVGVLDTNLSKVLECYAPDEPVASEVRDLPACALYYMVGGWISFDRQPGTPRPLAIVANEGDETNPVDEYDVVKTSLGASDPATARRAIEEFGARHGLTLTGSSGTRHLIMVGDLGADRAESKRRNRRGALRLFRRSSLH